MKIIKVDGTVVERPVTAGDVVGKKTFKRTNKAVYLGNQVQHGAGAGGHNEVGSKLALMYITGDLYVVEIDEWKALGQ